MKTLLRKLPILLVGLLYTTSMLAQQGPEINPDGIIFPKLPSEPANNVSTEGQIIYNTSLARFRTFDGSAWVDLQSGGTGGMQNIIGDNNDGDTKVTTFDNGFVDYIDIDVDGFNGIRLSKALSDDIRLELLSTSSLRNTFIGREAGLSNTNNGDNNTFVGYNTGKNNIDGDDNTYFGVNAGNFNDHGSRNTNVGRATGYRNKGNDNTYLGYFSGVNSDDSERQILIGSEAGYNTEGNDNVFIGFQSGRENTGGGEENVALGNYSLQKNGLNKSATNHSRYNTAIGHNAGKVTDTGYNNVFVGKDSGLDNVSGYQNTFVGYHAGDGANSQHNVYVGDFAGNNNEDGQYNSSLGSSAGSGSVGDRNVFIGAESGIFNTGTGNVFIGHEAGRNVVGGPIQDVSNTLVITNSEDENLIYGEFDNQIVRIAEQLQVSGASTAVLRFERKGTSNWDMNLQLGSGGDLAFKGGVDGIPTSNVFLIEGNGFIQLKRLDSTEFTSGNCDQTSELGRMGYNDSTRKMVVCTNDGGNYHWKPLY